MIKQFTLSELYAHSRERPIGESLLDALIPMLHSNPGLQAKTIAKYLGVKTTDLSGAVRILTGRTMDALLSQWRMYKALDLLRNTELPFSDVAIRCGYRQYKHLAKAMKRELRITPFEYRNGYRRTVQRPISH